MKISIKFKIVALGIALSALVTSVAVIFANFEYRRRSESNIINNIDNTLDGFKYDITNPSYGQQYVDTVAASRKYVLEQYELYQDLPPEDATLEQQKNFYKSNFTWLYTIENMGMYLMSDEEMKFRDNYEEFTILISGIKRTAKAEAAYLAFITDDNTLFYVADEYSYTKVMREGMHFPGSRMYNFPGKMVQKGDYYNCNFNNKLNRVIPIYNGELLLGYVFVEYNFTQVNSEVKSLITMEIIVLSITSVLMVLAYALGAHFLFLRNVSKLTKTTSAFTSDLEKGKTLEMKNPNIKSNDEIHALSNSFIALEEGIIKYVDLIQQEAKEKERAGAELAVATNIQLGALPNCRFDDNQVSVRAFIKSAKEVGGDFYDYFYLDDNRLAVIISDVSGKGIPAALFMMKSKELLKSAVRTHDSLVDAVKEVNTMLVNNNNELLFVTSFIGIIDFKKKQITYVNAGHEKPYIVSKNNVKKLVGESNFVMGGVDGFEYKQETVSFNKGDYLFLFTDGLNESINDKEEEFSYERIEETLKENDGTVPSEIIDSVNHKLEQFVGNKEQFDDVTMVVVKYLEDELHLSYDKKDYSIITDIVDKFEDHFSSLDEEVKSKTGIIIDELVNNLVSYEDRDDLEIDVSFKKEQSSLSIIIRCNGNDYNPFANHKEKYLEEYHPDIKEGGFGLSIIKDLAKSYDYDYKDNHSIVTITLETK